jgi:hypothetical protein
MQPVCHDPDDYDEVRKNYVDADCFLCHRHPATVVFDDAPLQGDPITYGLCPECAALGTLPRAQFYAILYGVKDPAERARLVERLEWELRLLKEPRPADELSPEQRDKQLLKLLDAERPRRTE